MKGECRNAFASAFASPSRSQLLVSEALRHRLGLWVQDEYQCPRSGYLDRHDRERCVAIRKRARARQAPVLGGGVDDGPDHLLACGSPTGATLLQHRLLKQMGYTIPVVSYWEWNQVCGDEASEAEYLRGKLE